MFKSGQVTSNLKHLELPLRYMHHLHEQGVLQCVPCSIHVQWDNTFTKQTPGPLFHLPFGTAHRKELTEKVSLSWQSSSSSLIHIHTYVSLCLWVCSHTSYSSSSTSSSSSIVPSWISSSMVGSRCSSKIFAQICTSCSSQSPMRSDCVLLLL